MSPSTLYRALLQWQADRASYLGAALAYHALFSIAPLLLLVIAATGIVYGQDAAEGKLVTTLTEYVGKEAAAELQNLVNQAQQGSGWATILGSALLILAALNLFRHLRVALHIIWKIPPRKEDLVEGTVRGYLLALATLLVLIVFTGLVFASSTIVTLTRDVWSRYFETPPSYLLTLFVVSVLLQTLALTFLFRILSEGHIAYRHLWRGALVTALLFLLGKWLFSLYLENTSVRSAYSEAGSLVVFLVWVYYSAQLIFFGAEVVQVQREGKEPDAQARE